MALITIGKIDKNLIYPLIPSIIILFENIYFDYLKIIAKHKAVFNIIQSISKCSALIPLIIFKLKNQKSKNQQQIYNKLYIKSYYEKKRVNNLQKGGFILLINVLNLFSKIIYFRIIFFDEVKIFSWFMDDIILITLFSFLILKEPIYKHQYLCIMILVVAGIILNVIHHAFDSIELKDIFASIIGDSVYSLMVVLKRYVMVNLFCSAYEIVVYEGVFSLVSFIILLIIFTNEEIIENDETERFIIYEDKAYIDNFFEFIEILKNDKMQILICFIILILYIPYYLYFNLTIKNNSAFHVLIILIAEENLFFEYEEDTFIICMNIILTIIILFMFLVFIEIIELNFCGLSTNLKRNITKRAEIETSNNLYGCKNNRDTLLEIDGLTIDFNDK